MSMMGNDMRDKVWAIVPAAGSGQRFSSTTPKQYCAVLGKPIIEHTLERVLAIPAIVGVVVSLARKDERWKNLAISKHPKVKSVTGGKERCHSVMQALEHLKQQHIPETAWVLIHDVNRPCLSIKHVNLLLKTVCQMRRNHVYGGLLGVPIRDTVKRLNAMRAVKETVDRADLWLAHTPQVFRFDILYEAMQRALLDNYFVTDEAAAIERIGYYPLMVQDSEENIKLTYPDDLKVITEILARQQT